MEWTTWTTTWGRLTFMNVHSEILDQGLVLEPESENLDSLHSVCHSLIYCYSLQSLWGLKPTPPF